MTMTVEARPIDSIKVDRRVRSDVGDLRDLVESMRQRGLLNPVTIGAEGALLAGERRLRAAQELGWTEIDVHVWAPKDQEPITELIALEIEGEENLCRLEFTPGEKERFWQRLVPLREQQLISGRTGRRSSSVTRGGPKRQAEQEVAKALGTSRTIMQAVAEVEQAAQDEWEPEEVRAEAQAQHEGLMAGTITPTAAERAVKTARKRGENLRKLAEQRRAEAEAMLGPGQWLAPSRAKPVAPVDWSTRLWNTIRTGMLLDATADELEVAEDRHALDASNVKGMIKTLQEQVNEREHLKRVLQTIQKEITK